jgi:hypothetical protein
MSNTASPTVVVDVERMIAFASGTAAAAVINGFNHINKHHHPVLQHLRIYDQCIAESQNLCSTHCSISQSMINQLQHLTNYDQPIAAFHNL